MIPGEKIDDFGLHAHKYYKLDHSVFKSQLDSIVLDRLWNEYWIHTLSSSPILSNKDFVSKSIINVVKKFNKITSSNVPGGGKKYKGSQSNYASV